MPSKNKIKISRGIRVVGSGTERSRGGGKKANSRINTSAPLYDGTLWIYPRSRRGCCVPRALLTQPPENVNAGSSPFLISSCFSLFYHCQAPSLSLALLSLSFCPTSRAAFSSKSNLRVIPLAPIIFLQRVPIASSFLDKSV